MTATLDPSARRHYADLPGPRGIPVFGNALQVDKARMHQSVEHWAHEYGPFLNTLESDAARIQQHLDKLFPALFQRIMAPLPTWRWFRTTADRQVEAAVAEVKRAIDGFIVAARARLAADPVRRERPPNLLEAMIVAADAGDSGLGDEDVAGNVLTMLLAGEDTTANTLAWMLFLMTRHPATLERARREVDAAFPPGMPLSHEGLADLDWIEACAHETMRAEAGRAVHRPAVAARHGRRRHRRAEGHRGLVGDAP